MRGVSLMAKEAERDLGVIVDKSLKLRRQAAVAVAKAIHILAVIKCSFGLIDR